MNLNVVLNELRNEIDIKKFKIEIYLEEEISSFEEIRYCASIKVEEDIQLFKNKYKSDITISKVIFIIIDTQRKKQIKSRYMNLIKIIRESEY